MKGLNALFVTGLFASAVAVYAADPAPVCNGHGKPADWVIQSGVAITLDVTIQVGSSAAVALSPGKEENLKSVAAGTQLAFHVEAGDQDNHVCQSGTVPLANYVQNSAVTVTIVTSKGAAVATLTLDTTPAAGDAVVRKWDKTWTVPDSAKGEKLSISFQGTADDVACTSHAGSDDASKSLATYSAKLDVPRK